MSDQNPYQTLGVTENASFEEIQAAKQQLNEEYKGNPQAVARVDAAYDAVIMDRLRLRKEGKIKVPDTIRFPEKQVEKPLLKSPVNLSQSPSWLQELRDQPSQQDILQTVGAFSLLSVVVLLAPASFTSLLLTGGLCASVYFLNRKEKRVGRAILISIITLVVGILVGAGLSGVIPPSISSDQVMALTTFILFALTSSFLK